MTSAANMPQAGRPGPARPVLGREPGSDPLRPVRRRLRVIRRAGRTLLAVRAASAYFSAALLLVAVLIFADYLVRFPAPARFVVLALLIAVAFIGARRLGLPVSRYRPPLADIALRVERYLDCRLDRHADGKQRTTTEPLRTRLAAGVGIAHDAAPDPLSGALTRLAEARVAGLLRATPWGMLRWKRPTLALAGLIGLAVIASVVTNSNATLASVGLTRLFAPWADAQWPRVTAIADVTAADIHPADTPLPLRATLLQSARAVGESRVTARVRVIRADGSATEYTEPILVPQPFAKPPIQQATQQTTQQNPGPSNEDAEDTSPTPRRGELYERLIDPARWAGASDASSPTDPTAETDRYVEYTIFSEDDRTATRRVRIVDPPQLREARVGILLPEYAQASNATRTEPSAETWLRGNHPTPVGDATLGPILAGSETTLTLVYSKPVDPTAEGLPADAVVRTDGRTVEISLSPSEPVGLTLNATDGNGFVTREPYRLRLSVVADRPPSVTVTEPSGSRAVLATAVIPLAARADDDLGIDAFSLRRQLARPANSAEEGGGESASAEPLPEGTPVTLASSDTSGARTLLLDATLDVSATGATPGDEIWIDATATDAYRLDGVAREPVVSVPRKIRIIEESRFLELLQDELEGVRRSAISLDERQEKVASDTELLREDPDRPEPSADAVARRQGEIARRLNAQASALDAIRERLDENRLTDERARALVDVAGRLAQSAAQSAERAAGQASEQARGDRDADPREAQQEVRDALADMIDRLDRGQDDWVVRRAIERLAQTQRALREQTATAGERTVGRDLDDLTPDERTELERIADRQRELAQQAQQAIDDLAERADELREADPTQSAALDQAARDAQRSGLTDAIRDAASQISQNQTGAATSLQDQSIEDLESILEGLENAQRMRDQALRRELASLMQSIRSLIRQEQETIDAIGALEAGEAGGEEADGLAQRVRANTLAAAASAGAFDEVAAAVDLLNRAASAQLGAIRALRAQPRDPASAGAASAEALARLQDALAEAERQDENAAQRERERQRRELVDAYREALEKQTSLRDAAGAFDPEQLTRRDRAQIRSLGRDQEALRVEIASIPGAHDIAPGGITDLYHERIESALGGVVRRLGRGQIDDAVRADQDASIDLLRSIVEVLSPAQDDQDPFDDQQSGGGGGGGGAGGQEQPPIGQLEELRLLRSLQELTLGETRRAAARGTDPDESLVDLQSRIAEQARRIIESMQGGGSNPGVPQDEAPNNGGPNADKEDGAAPAEGDGDDPGEDG